MDFYIGTSGFSYKSWKGNFYPDKIKDSELLAWYSRQLTAVEINNTFYRMPRREVLQKWAAETPENFRFIIKASRRITHYRHLRNVAEPMEYLFRNIAELGTRLGALLFQLPPNMRCNLDLLAEFLELVPPSVPVSFEFRNESWFDDRVFDCLAARNISICHADSEDRQLPFVSTADWGYLRLRKPEYDLQALDTWHKTIVDSGWQNAYVFFKHEADGAGPEIASRFLAMCN